MMVMMITTTASVDASSRPFPIVLLQRIGLIAVPGSYNPAIKGATYNTDTATIVAEGSYED
jgi:hypothetical protein